MLKEEIIDVNHLLKIEVDDEDCFSFEFFSSNYRNFFIVDAEWMEENNSKIETSIQKIMDLVSTFLQNDPHEFNRDTCATCKNITGLVGKSFGCMVEKK